MSGLSLDLLENLPHAFAYHRLVRDSDGRASDYVFLYVNDAFIKITGLRKENIIGQKVTSVFPDISNTEFNWIEVYSNVEKTGQTFNFEQYFEPLRKWYDITASSNEKNHFCTTFRDITEKKLSQVALADSEKSKSNLLSNLPGMVYRCKNDSDWTMEFASDGCYELTGYNAENLIGNKTIAFNDLILPQYRDKLVKKWEQILFEKSQFKEEYEIKTASGKTKWVLETGEGVFDKDGKTLTLEGFIFDITDRKANEKKLETISEIYELTGLYNKRKLDKTLKFENSINISKRAVLLLNFQKVNLISLSYGYTYTEYLMKRIASVLKTFVNDKNSLYQISIDKFLIYVNEYIERKELTKLSKLLLNAIRQLPTIQTTGCNIGIYKFEKTLNADYLIKNALAASEHIEQKELFGFSYFNERIRLKIQRSSNIKELLLEVVNGSVMDAFDLEYQPIIDVKSKRVVGYEALARLHSKNLGRIPPDEFIPIAEETQLIIPLGSKIITLACEFIKKLIIKENSDARVFVNISAVQLLRSDFIPVLQEAFSTTNINPSNFGLEITESIFFDQFELINKKFKILKKLGVCISIDDFGTGYSSLAREGELNVNSIKIDKYFIDKITENNPNKVIAGDIISMAHKLGHKVVAEGVEKREQLEYLAKYNCDMVQGFFFSESIEANMILKGDEYDIE